jgi:chromosome segregation ATPase
VIDSGSK